MEVDLIIQAQKGDREAFRQIYEHYAGVAFKTAWALLGNRVLAEDVTQDVWLEVWRHLSSFHASRPFKSWLLAIVTNRCRNAVRRNHSPVAMLDEDLLPEAASGVDVELQYVRQEEDGELRRIFATLSDDQRQVIELRYFAELDLAEIAAVLHIPLGTVKSRLHRALEALRLRLPPELARERPQ
jgi:RNA polymerase sigma-70 factor, ECF subfamily